MRNRENMQIRVQRSFYSLDFLIFKDSLQPNSVDVVSPVEFIQIENFAAAIVDPTIKMPLECGQALMDDLWMLGFRPSDGISSAGQDEAQKAHILDLRSIVRKLLDIEK